MEGQHLSLVPANTKKATLWFGFLRPTPDMVILVAGILLSVLVVSVIPNATIWMLIVSLLPAIIAIALVAPIPNYHNVLVTIQSIIRFYRERKKFVWKGWCVYDESKDDK